MEIKNYFAQDDQGNIMPSANCYLYLPGTTTLATGLVDGSGTPISNPFLASSVGQVTFGAPNGVYDLRIAQGARDFTIEIQCADLLQALNETASFLGAKSSAPTTRNDGSALQIADRYFNTGDQLEYLYKSTGWVANNLDWQLLATSQGASLLGALMQDGSPGTIQDAINYGDNSLRQELAAPGGSASLGRGVVSLSSISDLATVKQDASLRYLVKGWHAGSDIGGDAFKWDATRARNSHNGGTTISPTVPVVGSQAGASISEKTTNYLNAVGETDGGSLGCFVRVSGYVTPEQFGAIRGVTEFSVSITGNQATKTSGSFTADDVGKKLQTFKAGTSNTSHASFIDSVSSATGIATLRTPAGTNVTDMPAHMGFCSFFQLRKMVDFVEAQGISLVHASGSYMMASNNGNILLGQQLNLSADKVDWNFSGSTFYGMLLLVRLSGGVVTSVKGAHMYGHDVVCLGDGLDALAGNTNWNAVAAAAEDSSIHSFTARMIGGCRGISLQTSSATAPIKNTQVYDFTLTADPVYGQTCDAIDISMSLANLIDGVTVRKGKTYNFGKILSVSNSTITLTNKNVSIIDIEAFGPCRRVGGISRTDGFLIWNFLVHEFAEEGFLTNTCDNGQILGGGAVCTGTSAAGLNVFDARVTKNPNSNIRVSGFKASSPINKFTQAAFVHAAHGLHVTDCDFDDGAYGIYDSGYSGSIENVRFRGNTSNVRPVSGSLLTFTDCFKLDAALKPSLIDESGSPLNAYVIFDGTGEIGSTMVIRRGHNILSLTKTAVGFWDLKQIRAGAGIPMVSGCGRQFGGSYGFITYGAIPGANAVTVRIALISAGGAPMDSDYISVFVR